MDIEFFPAEKSCEQGCSICPLARKDLSMAPKEIDKDAQKTFSIIENLFRRNNITYNLHTTSLPHLFPKLQYPELIKMARFETNKSIRENGNPRDFSENLKMLFIKNRLDPKILGFSIVPTSPLVSADDAQVLQQLIEELSRWYFALKYKKIEVTVRSNLIKMELFNEIRDELFNASKIHLKGVAKQFCSLTHWSRKPLFFKFPGGLTYYNEYRGKIGTNQFILKNRVIGAKKTEDSKQVYKDQAETLIPRSLKSPMSLAIAPKGIMFNHVSLAINNPLLWISHTDFRTALETASSRKNFTIMKFMRSIMLENLVMYDFLPKQVVKEGIKLTNDHWMALFEHYRPEFIKPPQKPR